MRKGDVATGSLFELPSTAPRRVWSPLQEAVFAEVKDTQRHMVIEAFAGSGKTTTIEELVRRIPRHLAVLCLAFNVRIRDELRRRVPSHIDVSTLNGLGFGAIRDRWKGVTVNPKRTRELVAQIIPRDVTRDDRAQVERLSRLAKSWVSETDDEIRQLMLEHDCVIDWDRYPAHGAAPGDWSAPSRYDEGHLFGWVRQVLHLSKRESAEVDFDDQVYIPAAEGWSTGSYDVVLVDETQDLSRGQIRLALRALRRGGRVIAVGDRHQAIYGFRGADSESMTRLIEALSQTTAGVAVLPLSVSYRCATSIVDEARTVVPEIESAPGAPTGTVAGCTSGAFFRALEEGHVREGAYVLSRTNAPLISMCLYALQCGVRASIQGKDIGRSLVTLLRRAERPMVRDSLEWLRAWVQTECVRLDTAGHEQAVEALRDRFECLVALSEGLRTVDEVADRIDALFADDGGPRLIFSSVHKAKGLEADTVYLLAPTFFHKKGDPREERNLYYVAVTRARRELVIVDGSPRSQKAQVAA
jgi:DNA helicase-2/ATP-dependent DNA helicase PcrA